MKRSVLANFRFPYILFLQSRTLKAYRQDFEDIEPRRYWQRHSWKTFLSDRRCLNLFCNYGKVAPPHMPTFPNTQTNSSFCHHSTPSHPESRRSRAWNCDIVAYGISFSCMESSRKYTFGDAIRQGDAIHACA